MAQAAKGFSLDLARAFAGDAKGSANLFEGAALAVEQAVAQLQNLAFAFGQLIQRRRDLGLQHILLGNFHRRSRRLVGQRLAHAALLLVVERL